jgi:hypothetical protein
MAAVLTTSSTTTTTSVSSELEGISGTRGEAQTGFSQAIRDQIKGFKVTHTPQSTWPFTCMVISVGGVL